MGNVYGAVPCRYRIRDLVQDCRNTGGLAMGNPVFAPQGSDYRIRMHWSATSINVPTKYDALAGLTFRGADDQNYYYLVFFLDHIGIARVRNNVGAEVATAPRRVDTNRDAMFTLLMQGNHFLVRDNAVTGNPVIIDWTDDLAVSPQGNHVDHWTRGGVQGHWVFAHGKPTVPPVAPPTSQLPARLTSPQLGGPRDPRRVLGRR
jgi:hypothetical protein